MCHQWCCIEEGRSGKSSVLYKVKRTLDEVSQRIFICNTYIFFVFSINFFICSYKAFRASQFPVALVKYENFSALGSIILT